MKNAFLGSLLRSDTFWSETFLFIFSAIGLCVALLIFIKLLSNRRIMSGKKMFHQNGAAAAIDFVLTLPIVMFVLFLVIQFALMANASLHVHYAAYSAAHSARIHFYDLSTPAIRISRLVPSSFLNNALWYSRINKSKAEEKALDSARIALISIGSPRRNLQSKPDTSSNAWKGIDAYAATLANQADTSQYAAVFKRKASYVFDNRNVQLEVGLVRDITMAPVAHKFLSVTEWPVEAKLSFEYVLTLPLAASLFGTKGHDGLYYSNITAAMTVL